MYPQPIERLIKIFSGFPGIGPRTACRFVFYLLHTPQKEIDVLLDAVTCLKQQVGVCKLCFNPFSFAGNEKSEEACLICLDKTRNQELLCIVEKESDLEAIEKTKNFQGFYFILGGTVGRLKQREIQGIRIKELKERLKDKTVKEVILATNLTTEGETTALFLERVLAPLRLKMTRLGRGLPIGSELEYADEETLKHALESRR